VVGWTLLLLNNASTIYTRRPEYLPTVRVDPAQLTESQAAPDGKTYKVWRVVKPIEGAVPGKYLVDDSGRAAYLIDPAINGRLDRRDDGTRVTKFDAPKAALMALIIDGILTEQLPWDLVLIGVFIAVVMQLSWVPALAFAVGVYLPLSASMPIFVGGLVRWAADRIRRTPPAESDSSPAILLSSGYIAGGAIAGILIAVLAIAPGASTALDLSRRLPASWNESPWPALVAFGALTVMLFLVGTGHLLQSDTPAAVQAGVSGRDERSRTDLPD
jgi:hypothetical protein